MDDRQLPLFNNLDLNKGLCDYDGRNIMMMAKRFVQATLPHSDPLTNNYKRTNGDLTVAVQSGIRPNTGEDIGIPYGVIPRLLVGYMTTWAMREKDPVIEINRKLSEFVRELGLNPDGGGVKSDRAKLLMQADRLFNCRVAFQSAVETSKNEGATMPIVDAYKFFNKDPDKYHRNECAMIQLSQPFYNSITSNPVPINVDHMRILMKGRTGPLKIDMYLWLAYESAKLREPHTKERNVPWASLMDQIGTHLDPASQDDRGHFAREAKKAIKEIIKVHPFVVTQQKGTLRVKKNSPAPIPPKEKRLLTY